MRQVVLDTETTGLEVKQGHRIIEIGCVELINRRLTGRHYHQYVNPQRAVDEGALAVHGIGDDFLADKPLFAQVADEFMEFVQGAELVIHNAPFDLGFLDAEILRCRPDTPTLEQQYQIVDTLIMARQKHPGQRNNLDALCTRYGVDNTKRDLHGALLDAEILADVFLAMTGGQRDLLGGLGGQDESEGIMSSTERRTLELDTSKLRVIAANTEELQAHEQRLQDIAADAGTVVWSD